jgi:hypothetical protein
VIVVAPRGLRIDDYLGAAAVGIDLEKNAAAWPRVAWSADADARRANKADAYAEAQDFVRHTASAIAAGRPIHVVIGSGIVYDNVLAPKVDDDGAPVLKNGKQDFDIVRWATVVNPSALADIAAHATAIYVAAGSPDPREYRD